MNSDDEVVLEANDPVRRRTGGRSARVREAVLKCALEAFAELGPEGLTFSELARRADVHATSIMRRWGTVENVFFDALQTYSQTSIETPNFGSLHDDLVAFAQSVGIYLATPLGEAILRMVASTSSNDTLGSSRDRFVQARIDAALILFQRAIERGELRPEVDPRLAFELVVGPLYLRTLVTRDPIDKAFVESMVATLLGGLAR